MFAELWLLLSKKFSGFDLDACVFVLRSWVDPVAMMAGIYFFVSVG